MFDEIDISASGLVAQRVRMDIIANNLANANTTRATVDLTTGRVYPYRRKDVLFKPVYSMKTKKLGGVAVDFIYDDPSDFNKVYDPKHPDAVKDSKSPDFGYVLYPNVNPVVEFTNMISATRSYEANVTAMDSKKSIFNATLRLLA